MIISISIHSISKSICISVIIIHLPLYFSTQVKYFPNFSAVVSSSNDEASSVVIGNRFLLHTVRDNLTNTIIWH